jgi:DNA primase
MIDLHQLRADNPLPSVVGAHMRLQRAGREWKGCCPFHSDRTPSFTIYDGGERFHCFGCGASGDVLDFVQRLHGVELVEAARMLGAGDLPTVALPALPPADEADRRDEARAIWEAALAAPETPAEAYLRARGITDALPSDIRFAHLAVGRSDPMPCLVAAVRDVAGEVAGIQRIFLRPDGRGKADMPKPKLSLGRIKGGAMRFGPVKPDELLTVCEGPEDALSLRQMFGLPVWAAAGASNLPHMQFPRQVRRVAIAADNDEAGERAAQQAARAFTLRGLTCRIIRPAAGFKDFNDELKGTR